jgi:hypothetical protein
MPRNDPSIDIDFARSLWANSPPPTRARRRMKSAPRWSCSSPMNSTEIVPGNACAASRAACSSCGRPSEITMGSECQGCRQVRVAAHRWQSVRPAINPLRAIGEGHKFGLTDLGPEFEQLPLEAVDFVASHAAGNVTHHDHGGGLLGLSPLQDRLHSVVSSLERRSLKHRFTTVCFSWLPPMSG